MPRRGGSPTIQVNVGGIEEFTTIAQKLRAAGNGKLDDDLRRVLKSGGARAVQMLRAEIRKFPGDSDAKRRDGKSFKDELADAISYRLTPKGLYIYVDRTKLPADSRLLPFAFERGSFRHPVFGMRIFVTQRGHVWFAPTMVTFQNQLRAEIIRAVEDFQRSLKL